jgi:hypothetical protein
MALRSTKGITGNQREKTIIDQLGTQTPVPFKSLSIASSGNKTPKGIQYFLYHQFHRKGAVDFEMDNPKTNIKKEILDTSCIVANRQRSRTSQRLRFLLRRIFGRILARKKIRNALNRNKYPQTKNPKG